MEEYTVVIRRIIKDEVVVKADSPEEAIRKSELMVSKGENEIYIKGKPWFHN